MASGNNSPRVALVAAGAYQPAASAEARQELVPVPASVFDDDFFTKGNEELRADRPWTQDSPKSAEKAPEPEVTSHWPDARVPSFAGYAGDAPPPPAESDELDIPAFLRRNH